MPKLCQYENCRSRASYGFNGKEIDRCSKHKEERKPQSSFCYCGKAQPIYNEPGETKAICCSQCKTPTMVNVKASKCKCGKAIPIYNEPGETKRVCCKECKTPTMIDIISKKCQCGKAQPTYNEPGEKLPKYCKECRKSTMVDVTHKKCQCGKVRPTYNEPEKTEAICCKNCKTLTMVDVINRKCKCGKAQPKFNEPGEIGGICCNSCKSSSMINVIHKKCQCGKAIPTYNELGQSIPMYCNSCKSLTMVDVTHKKCKGQGNKCPQIGNPKYKGYCAFCFQHEFPDDPLSFQIRCKTKEIAVREYINKNFEGFIHDKTLETGHCDCSIRRRIDHRKLINGTLLVIETDENQHKSYNEMDEQTRYDDLFMAYSGKWIYIRFNPDKYNNKDGKSKNPNIATRLFVLKEEIEKQIKRIENNENTELVERVYLYYDNYD